MILKTIKIITDSTAYLSKEYVEAEGVGVVSLSYTFDNETKKEGFSGEFDDYFLKLKNSESFPTTSQPSTGDFYEVFNDALRTHDKVIAIFLSSKLSGTYLNASIAKDMIENEKKNDIYIIDSQLSAAALTFLVEDAVEMVKLGNSVDEIITHVENKRIDIQVLLTPGSLEYLSRGGRLSSLEYKMGNFLKIKPILELKDGELKMSDKVRGRKKVVSTIIDKINNDVSRIAICQILALNESLELKEKLHEVYPQAKITIEDLGPVIGSHLGDESIGICFY